MPTISSTTSDELSSRPRVGAALAVWLLLAGAFVFTAFYSRSTEPPPRDALYDPDLAIGGFFFYGALVVIAFLVAALLPNTLRDLGFRAFERRWLWKALGVAVLTIVVSLVLEPFLHAGEKQGLAPEHWQPEHAAAFAANVVVTVLVGPFAEEVFFRGLGVRVLSILGAAVALVGSALIFGLVHGLLAALPPLAFFGLGLAWIRLRSGSIWPTIAAHVAYNGLGIVLLAVSWAAGLDTGA
jgi:uncharacterized protein